MKSKNSINDILQSADTDIIDKIASGYVSVDPRTKQRMYEECVRKINARKASDSGFTEIYTAESYRRQPFWKVAALTAVCFAAIVTAVFGIKNIRAPQPVDNEHPPVLFEETTVTTIVTSTDTTDTTVITSLTTGTAGNEVIAVITNVSADNNDRASSTTSAKSDGKKENSDTADRTSANSEAKNNTTQTTTAVSVTDSRLAELDAKEAADTTVKYPRERQIILGNYPADSERPTYTELEQIAAESSTREDIVKKLAERYPYPDRTAENGKVTEYWANFNGTERISVTSGESWQINYVYGDPEKIRCILPAPESDTAAELRRQERSENCAYIRKRAVMLGLISNDSPRLTLDKAKQFAAESRNFSEFWQKLDKEQPYPDLRGSNGSIILMYYLNDEGDKYILVSPDLGYAEYYDKNTDTSSGSEIINDPEGVRSSDVRNVLNKMSEIEEAFR